MKLISVIVTYNRLKKLKNTLAAYENQITHPYELIVVDNFSNDGTSDYLKQWVTIPSKYKKKVKLLDENQGGSGGFYVGEKEAIADGADWVLVADDDAYPNEDAISRLIDTANLHKNEKIAAFCSVVTDIEGKIAYNHRRVYKYKYGFIFESKDSINSDYKKQEFDINLFSYVGTLLNVEAMKEFGLCNPDFFIYCDDTEHSIRMNKFGRIICDTKVIFIHDSGQDTQNLDKSILMTWREYYGHRNFTYMLKNENKAAMWYSIFIRSIRIIIKYIFEPSCLRLFFSALNDGYMGYLGKNILYKPGFAIKK